VLRKLVHDNKLVVEVLDMEKTAGKEKSNYDSIEAVDMEVGMVKDSMDSFRMVYNYGKLDHQVEMDP